MADHSRGTARLSVFCSHIVHFVLRMLLSLVAADFGAVPSGPLLVRGPPSVATRYLRPSGLSSTVRILSMLWALFHLHLPV